MHGNKGKKFICQTCKKVFTPKDQTPAHLKRRPSKFCSRKCSRPESRFKKGQGYWLGKKRPPRSKEWQAKINKKLKGNTYGRFLKGIKRSEETKRKMGLAKMGHKYNVGRKHTIEKREKDRKGKLGKKNPNWKGGITPMIEKIRKSLEYRLWREAILERDKYLCQMPMCEKQEHYIEAHHIKPFALYPGLRFALENGITLCKNCHQKTKSKEKKFEKLFLEITYLYE